jgi:histidinol-phosphate/aromatic aminotransferase/cobyric acid decarboxylase-like protein
VGLDDSYFRVTVRSPKENVKLIETLRKALKKTN